MIDARGCLRKKDIDAGKKIKPVAEERMDMLIDMLVKAKVLTEAQAKELSGK